jgi:hypothetical protein
VAKLFGSQSVAAISVVEPPLSRWYAQRARLVFYVVTAGAGLMSAGALWQVLPGVLAVSAGAVIGAVLGFGAAVLVRAWPVLRALWWWALEIVTAGLLGGVVLLLSRVMPMWAALTVLLAVAGGLALVRPVRLRVMAWVWCVAVRHRIRHCFAGFLKTQKTNAPVPLPLILLARPTPAGERVWLWLRPGLDLAALDGKTGLMAVACWSSEVQVMRASDSFAALVRVDITRRDALRDMVVSPLLERFGLAGLLPTRASSGAVPVGLDLDEVPEPERVPVQRTARR